MIIFARLVSLAIKFTIVAAIWYVARRRTSLTRRWLRARSHH